MESLDEELKLLLVSAMRWFMLGDLDRLGLTLGIMCGALGIDVQAMLDQFAAFAEVDDDR